MAEAVQPPDPVARGPGRGTVAPALPRGQAVRAVRLVEAAGRGVGRVQPERPAEPVAQGGEPGAVGMGDPGARAIAEGTAKFRRVRGAEGSGSFDLVHCHRNPCHRNPCRRNPATSLSKAHARTFPDCRQAHIVQVGKCRKAVDMT